MSLPGFGSGDGGKEEDPIIKTTVISPYHAPSVGKTVPAVAPRQHGRTITLTQRVEPKNVRQRKTLLKLIIGVGIRDMLVAGCGTAALVGAQVASGGAVTMLCPAAVGGIVVLSRFFEQGLAFAPINLGHWFQPQGRIRERLSEAGEDARELVPRGRPQPQLYARLATGLTVLLTSVQASAANLLNR